MNKPETPPNDTTPTQDIGKIQVRVEEGLTSDKPEDGSLADQQLDGIAGGATPQLSADGKTVASPIGGIVGGIPTSKLMPE